MNGAERGNGWSNVQAGSDGVLTRAQASHLRLCSPSIAISEKDGQIKVCAELPGMSKNDVRVELTQAGLIISGEHKRTQDDRREGIYWSERFCGSFMRTIPIPDWAQVEKVTATF